MTTENSEWDGLCKAETRGTMGRSQTGGQEPGPSSPLVYKVTEPTLGGCVTSAVHLFTESPLFMILHFHIL